MVPARIRALVRASVPALALVVVLAPGVAHADVASAPDGLGKLIQYGGCALTIAACTSLIGAWSVVVGCMKVVYEELSQI